MGRAPQARALPERRKNPPQPLPEIRKGLVSQLPSQTRREIFEAGDPPHQAAVVDRLGSEEAAHDREIKVDDARHIFRAEQPAMLVPAFRGPTAFVGDWSGERLVIRGNRLAPGIKLLERH